MQHVFKKFSFYEEDKKQIIFNNRYLWSTYVKDHKFYQVSI